MCNLEFKILEAVPESGEKTDCIELINRIRADGEDALSVRSAILSLCQKHYLKEFEPGYYGAIPKSVSVTPLGLSAKNAQREQRETLSQQRAAQKRSERLNLAVLLVSALSLLAAIISLFR